MRGRIGSKKAAILLAALLLSVVTVTVLADATMTAPVGPTWDGPNGNWVWTMTVSAISGNDKTVCVGYSIDGGAESTMECSCSGGSCPVGNWTCTLPGASVANALTSVDWRIGTWGNACNQYRTAPPGNESGDLGPTGPNAITLSALDATPSLGGLIAIALLVAGLLGAGVVLVLMLSSRRRGAGYQ